MEEFTKISREVVTMSSCMLYSYTSEAFDIVLYIHGIARDFFLVIA